MTGYHTFHFPDACYVGQRIAKTLFAENGPLTPTDRRTFKNEIEEAVCAYVLNPDNAYLNVWADDAKEYDSLAVLEVALRQTEKTKRIAEIFHRSMPYPLLLIFTDADRKIMFSMAEKRVSRDGRDQVVLEHVVNTSWHTEASLETFHQEADYAKFRKNTFRDLYLHYMNLLEALNCSVFTGKLQIDGIDPETRRQGLEELHRLELELTAIKAQAKKENELAKLIELNMQAKRIDLEIHEIHEKLSGNHE